MASIKETPLKKRRLQYESVSDASNGDISDSDFHDLLGAHETVATLPVARASTPTQLLSTLTASSSVPYVTQPTQLVEKTDNRATQIATQDNKIQVLDSSPLRVPGTPLNRAKVNVNFSGAAKMGTGTEFGGKPKVGESFARGFAPPGTTYKPPAGIVRAPITALQSQKKRVYVDISDDEGPKYAGGSSDEDSQWKRQDIKPSVIKRKKDDTIISALGGTFGEALKNWTYEPAATSAKVASIQRSILANRSSDIMANAYGGSNRSHQTGFVKTIQNANRYLAPTSIDLDNIVDSRQRKIVENLHNTFPKLSIAICHQALIMARGNENDAAEKLLEWDEKAAERTANADDDEVSILPTPNLLRSGLANQTLKPPIKSIHQRYGGSQARRNLEEPATPKPTAARPRRRLMQGRRKASPPPLSSSPAVSTCAESVAVSPRSLAEIDSGHATESSHDGSPKNLLAFFNSCSIGELTDIASTTRENAELIIAKRPYKSLGQVRKVEDPAEANKPKKGGKRLPVGDKIVDKCEMMWEGYQAVDKLVANCEEISKSARDEMAKWGLDAFGVEKVGRVSLMSFEDIELPGPSCDSSTFKDSGISSPEYMTVSAEEEDDDDAKKVVSSRAAKMGIFPQPKSLKDGVKLMDYQLVGVNWMALLFRHGLSCILGDDMGLGKTIQVIAFLAHLQESGIAGPHLVVVPASVVENWLVEFQKFCPNIDCKPYHGSLSERAIARAEMDWETPYVIVTGYKTVSRPEDHRFLRKRNFNVCVFDEGHTLKNSETQQYEKLLRIPAKFRVLLTGTPLQNNLSELATLLTFLLPNVFLVLKDDLKAIFSHKAKTSDDEHAGLLSAQRIRRAKSMLAPFILRRKKEQVSLKTLPAKHRRIQDCVLPPAHQAIYDGELTQGLQKARDRNAGIKVARATNTNLTTTLRYAAIHPLLLRKIFNDKILGEITQILMDIGGYSSYNKLYEELAAYNDFQLHQLCKSNGGSLEKYALHNDEWMQSGKVDALIALLQEYEANGDRALVFSQYKLVLDILEPVLNTLGFKYQRLDGSTPTDLRLTLINDFADDPTILVFLLTTKAGGVGINLPCANKVVIFDIGHNPQEEIQAENRAHRVGQTREVEVVRLLALNTVEKNMWRMQEAKMLLDERVTGAPVQEEKVVQGEGEGEGTVMERIIDELLDEDEVKKNSEGGEDEGKDVGRGAKKDVEVMELDDKTN